MQIEAHISTYEMEELVTLVSRNVGSISILLHSGHRLEKCRVTQLNEAESKFQVLSEDGTSELKYDQVYSIEFDTFFGYKGIRSRTFLIT